MRLEFFKLLGSINKHCFVALFALPAESLKLVIDALVYGARVIQSTYHQNQSSIINHQLSIINQFSFFLLIHNYFFTIIIFSTLIEQLVKLLFKRFSSWLLVWLLSSVRRTTSAKQPMNFGNDFLCRLFKKRLRCSPTQCTSLALNCKLRCWEHWLQTLK